MLKQIFGLADSTGDGFIDEEELIAMHQVLGEPLTPSEATSAFMAMDLNESGNISFDDFLSWYTLAHARSGMLSKRGRRAALATATTTRASSSSGSTTATSELILLQNVHRLNRVPSCRRTPPASRRS